MWLCEQQKKPVLNGTGQTGVVTMAGDSLAVRLECEVRSPELYGPAGYQWTPRAGDRVLVFKGEGERPCIVGVQQETVPESITLQARSIQMQGAILVNGITLEEYITMLAKQAVEVSE